MDLISIIVPVYGVEKYLEQCVESLCAQTYSNLEILLIDDGSKDNSGAICDRLAEEDKRIQVYHKENGGISSARNYGIDRCRGNYICFVDSDDYVEKDYCLHLYEAITAQKADIALCFENAFEDGSAIIREPAPIAAIKVEDYEGFIEHLLDPFKGYMCWAWNKMLKRELAEKVRFTENTVMEDVLYISELAQYVSKAVWIPERLVNYRQRQGSIMHADLTGRNMNYIQVLRQEYDMVKKYDHREDFIASHGIRCISEIYYIYKEMREYGDKTFWNYLNENVDYIYKDLDKKQLKLIKRIKYSLIVKHMQTGR